MKRASLALIFSVLATSSSFANILLHKQAYNACVFEVMNTERSQEFIESTPDQQAHICFDILQKSHPELPQKIDFEAFKKGFYDGRYR